MFTINQGKGLQMTFSNGWTVSIQFGYGNYCSNRYIDTTLDEHNKGKYSSRASKDAEIAAM